MIKNLPFELVDLIADFHDYEKYCKPKHKELFSNVLNDFDNIFNIFVGNNIMPNIVYICWGNGWINYNNNVHNYIESQNQNENN